MILNLILFLQDKQKFLSCFLFFLFFFQFTAVEYLGTFIQKYGPRGTSTLPVIVLQYDRSNSKCSVKKKNIQEESRYRVAVHVASNM